ncbi:MAG: PEP-CTERM sorting domain-containing protein [Sedimentisphaerales bacterium]|nr:PEP-CTERM sorting domain-containing protein [Sedimentisphaerales bacterium]
MLKLRAKWLAGLLCLALVGTASAAVIVIDDFESYADDAALQAAWVVHPGGEPILESLETVNGSTAMLIDTNQSSIYWSQTKLSLPGAVPDVHGVNFVYAGHDALSVDVKVPANQEAPWVYLGGTGGLVYLSLFDCWGQQVLYADIPNYDSQTTANGTNITWEIPFATATLPGMNLENVATIAVGYKYMYRGRGGLFIDNVALVPEPATMSLLVLGGVALLRRRRH